MPTIARARAGSADPFDRLWRLLSSVRFAILLISIATLGIFIGTLVMQAPADVAGNPDSFAAWLARPRGKYGEPWATLFGAIDGYRVFSSLWFRGTLAVLTFSVIVCTLNRLPGIVASVRRPAVKVPERLFERAPLRAELRLAGLAPDLVAGEVRRALAQRFRVIPWHEGEALGVFADRNRFGKLGTFLNHIGIVTILGAAVLGNVVGWREEGFMVAEGSLRPVGHQTGLVVRNDGFTDEYYPSGAASDFRSDLVLLKDGQEVARKTIRVNDPLDYGGVRFHQAFFGPAAVMRVRDADGKIVFEDGVPLGYEFTSNGIARNGGFFTLGNRNGLPTLAVYVLVPSAARRAPDPAIPAGSVRLELFEPRQAKPSAIETVSQGTPKESLGYSFEFVREKQFSGLQVVHNPAVPVIWFGATCMLLGALAVFNFPLRRLWARVDTAGEGVRVRLAAVSNRDVLFAREFESLTLQLETQLRRLPAAERDDAAAASIGELAAAG